MSEKGIDTFLIKLERRVNKLNNLVKQAKRKDIPDLIEEAGKCKSFVELLYNHVEQHELYKRRYFTALRDIELDLRKILKRIAKKKKPAWAKLVDALFPVFERISKTFKYWEYIQRILDALEDKPIIGRAIKSVRKSLAYLKDVARWLLGKGGDEPPRLNP
jgi:hypothetical protein